MEQGPPGAGRKPAGAAGNGQGGWGPVAAAGEVLDDEIDLRQYLRVLWKRRWVVVGVTLAAAASAYALTRAATPVYEASTTLLIVRGESPVSLSGAAGELLGVNRPSVQNFVELLRSRTVMTRALQQLAWPGVKPDEDAPKYLTAVTVQPVQGTDHIRVRVRLPDPARAQALANALVEQFRLFNQEMSRRETRSALEFIEQQLGQVGERLRESENALLRYKQRQRLVEPTQEAKARIDKLAELEKMRSATAVALSETATRLRELEQQLKAVDPTLTASTTLAANPLLQNYQVRLADLEVRLSGALQTLSPNHPQVAGLRAEIEEIRRRMSREVERVVSAETRALNPVFQELTQQYIALQVERVALAARDQALQRLAQAEQAALMGLPAQEMELMRLARDQRVNEEIYVLLRTRYEELRIQEAMVTGSVRVVDPAVLPADPVWPRPLLNLAVGLFLGLFLGVGLVFGLEFMDSTISEDEDLERLLGAPVLGRIPIMRPSRAQAESR